MIQIYKTLNQEVKKPIKKKVQSSRAAEKIANVGLNRPYCEENSTAGRPPLKRPSPGLPSTWPPL